jgi:hypothetical protein
MREIKLTKGFVAMIDDDDYDLLNTHHWYTSISKTHHKTNYYACCMHEYKYMSMHQFIIGKAPKGYIVDHKDGNGLNNRRDNLRYVTKSQNAQNMTTKKTGSSKYKGVAYSKFAKKFQAHYMKDYKHYHLGYFNNEIDAAIAYDSAVRIAFGEFARTNF